MPISNIESHAGPFSPDGVVTDFPFAFDMFVTDGAPGIAVARIAEDGSSAILDPGLYSVIPGDQGGTIRFATAPAPGDPLFILSTPSFKQQIAFSNQAPYLPEVVTNALDRAAARDIYMNGLLQRAILMPPGETVGNAPVAADRAGKVLGFDDTGELLVGASYSDLLSAASGAREDAGIAREAAQQAVAATISGKPIKTVSGNYSLLDSDLGFHVRVNANADAEVRFDPASYRDGWYAEVEQYGPATIHLKPVAGVTVNSKSGYNNVNLQFGVFTVLKTSAASGIAYGDLTSIYTPPPPPVGNPAVLDDFSGSSSTITARTTTQGSKTWAATAYTGSNNNPITTDGSGRLSGGQGSAANGTFVTIQTDTSNSQWITYTGKISTYTGGSAIGSGLFCPQHLTIAAGGGTAGLSGYAFLRTGAAGVAGSCSLRAFLNGTVNAGGGTAAGGAFSTSDTGLDDDSYCLEWAPSGSDKIVTLYHNGRRLGNQVVATQLSQAAPLTYKHGFRGSIPASSASEFTVGDPNSQLMARLFAPNRVLQREANGSLNLKVRGKLTVQNPGSLQCRIDDASGSQLFDWTTLSNFSTDDQLNFKGNAPTIDTPPSAGIVFRVQRNDIVSSGHAVSPPSPIAKAGEVILWLGQSLEVNPLLATSGGALAAPADYWAIHGLIGTQVGNMSWPTPDTRRQFIPASNTPIATFGATAQNLTSAFPMCNIIGGRGATDATQRAPGSDNYSAVLDGIDHAGGDFGSFIYIGGQYDLQDTAKSTAYTANVKAEVQALMAVTGRPVKGLLVPCTSVWGADDVRFEALNKSIWQACQDNPDLFFLGPYLLDIKHVSGDQYHFENGGYDEEMRRLAYLWNLMRGQSVKDLRGPKLFSVARNNDGQCTVTIDLNGADSVTLLNAAAHGDRRGGLRFSGSSSFATTYNPTGHSIGAVVAGKQAITYSFSDTPFSGGAAFVSGPYGSEPFNYDKLPDVRNDMANLASMLVGQYSGLPSIPIQPFYQAAGLGDYVSG